MASLLRTRARPKSSLLFPGYEDTTKERGKLDAFRLPPVEDCLDDVRRETSERQEPADVGVRHALLSGKVGDRLGIAGSFASAVRCLGMAGKARVGRGLVFGSRGLGKASVVVAFRLGAAPRPRRGYALQAAEKRDRGAGLRAVFHALLQRGGARPLRSPGSTHQRGWIAVRRARREVWRGTGDGLQPPPNVPAGGGPSPNSRAGYVAQLATGAPAA